VPSYSTTTRLLPYGLTLSSSTAGGFGLVAILEWLTPLRNVGITTKSTDFVLVAEVMRRDCLGLAAAGPTARDRYRATLREQTELESRWHQPV
jgi:hypothetical protein